MPPFFNSDLTEDEFLHLRARLHRYFEAQSVAESVAINPASYDHRALMLRELLYDEHTPDRSFQVNPCGDRTGLDAFTKKTGLDFEISLLQVFVGSGSLYFPALWNVYVKWMHERV